MRRDKITVLLMLLIVICVPHDFFGGDESSVPQGVNQVADNMDIMQPAPELPESPFAMEKSKLAHDELNIECELKQIQAVAGTDGNNDDCRQNNQEQQTDVLDELLIESTDSGAAYPPPFVR